MTSDSGSRCPWQPRCEGERPANNARHVRGTKGLFFTQSTHGRLLQLLSPPQTMAGNPPFALEFPSVALTVSQPRGCVVVAELRPGGFVAFFKKNPTPCQGAAGGSW